jgi:16S rRNA (uracil1498-N3)-methyltransferase
MNVFVCGEIKDETTHLLPEEAFHCYKVLRHKAGDEITLIDGKGSFYTGIIREISRNDCAVSLRGSWREPDRGYSLHLAVAPTKNSSRFEWFIEKAIEIGVDEITPLLCEHGERKKMNRERLERIALAAVKQSLTAHIPVIHPPSPLQEFLEMEKTGIRICAHLDQEKQHLKNIVVPGLKYTILIGPEGDFSVDELDRLNKTGWQMAILGKKRLRTETAGIVAAQIINGIHF